MGKKKVKKSSQVPGLQAQDSSSSSRSQDDDLMSKLSEDSNFDEFASNDSWTFESAEPADSNEQKSMDEVFDQFSEAVGELDERSAATREAALRKMIRFFLSPYGELIADQYKETCISGLLEVLHKPSKAEAVLATRALAIYFLLVGAEEDALFERARPVLLTIATRNRHTSSRVGALFALALGCFVCVTEPTTTDAVLNTLELVMAGSSEGLPVPDEMKAASMCAWSFLSAIQPVGDTIQRSRSRVWEAVHGLMLSNHVNGQIQSGEVAAFLISVARQASSSSASHWEDEVEEGGESHFLDEIEEELEQEFGFDDDEDDDEEEEEEEFDYSSLRRGGEEEEEEALEEEALAVLSESSAKVVQVIDRIHALTQDNNRRLKKKVRRMVRSHFRMMAHSIEGEDVERRVRVDSTQFLLVGWEKVKVFEFFRTILQDSFLDFLRNNETLHDILSLSRDIRAELTGLVGSERDISDKNSTLRRQRSLDRDKDRRRKQNQKDAFMND